MLHGYGRFQLGGQAMNPRYLAYCRAHGKTPDQMMAHDDEKYPGGKMCGFLLWSSARLFEYSAINPKAFLDGHLHDHKSYDAWLDSVSSTVL